MEHLVLGLWRAPGVEASRLHRDLIERWAPAVLEHPGVGELVVSTALADQGPFASAGSLDAMVSLGLERAHDLDDVPERDLLHVLCGRIDVWRVTALRPKEWQRTWADGEWAPGVKRLSLVRRRPDLTHEQFVRHWTERHAPLALRHHVGMADYTQHVVRRTFSPGGRDVDGIAELRFRSRDDLDQRFYDSDAGKAVIRADVAEFIDLSAGMTTLMAELPLRTATV